MNIQDAKEEICRAIKAYTAKNEAGLYRIPTEHRRPLLLMGPPGIGKTAIVKQAAAQCQVGFLSYAMTHHTRQSAIGLPIIRERAFRGTPYSITEYTMSEIVGDILQAMEETGVDEGILFLDEINCVSETLLPTILRLLQFKTFGSHQIPDGWILVAAGNPPGRYNRSSRELDLVTLDRVRLLALEPDLNAWKSYALSHAVHGAVLSYLSLRPDHFYVFLRTESGKEFVTPRSWEDLSAALELYESLSLPVDVSFFSQYLQCNEVCEGFSSYYRLFTRLTQNPGLDTLTRSGVVPEAFPSLEQAPADETLCLAEYLVHNLHRQVLAWNDKQLLAESLSYFLNGLEACRPDFSNLEEVCRELLKKRSVSLQKKKEFGLLSPGEEKKELLLAGTVKALASETKLRRLETEKTMDQDPHKKTGAVSGPAENNAINIMRKLSGSTRSEAENDAARLKAVFFGILRFIPAVFGDGLTSCLFFTELLEHPETKAFLSGHMEEVYRQFLEFV